MFNACQPHNGYQSDGTSHAYVQDYKQRETRDTLILL
jgi:hypothetical protein